MTFMQKIRTQNNSYAKGGIREMLAIAMPMVISHACYTVMTFTDRMFLSRLSPELMNAAMAGGLTAFMMMTFFIGLTGYVTALVAQYLGAGKKDQCAVIVTQAVIIAFLGYPIILACRPLAHYFFDVMGIVPGQIGPQKVYFDILLYAVIISLLRTCLSAFFSGVGRTRIVMLASMVAMIVNVAVNYVLIFGKLGFPALGIRGAAFGTIIGGASGLCVLFFAYFGKANRKEYNILKSLHFDRMAMKTLLHFGYPAGLEMFLNLLAFDTMIIIFHSVGKVAATATTIVFNWDMVSFLPLLGIEVGVTSLVGRYMGAGDPDTAHRATMSGLKMGLVYSAMILILFMVFPAHLVEVFRPAEMDSVFTDAQLLAVFMIRVASIYVLVEAMIVVFIGALRGAGDTFWAMFISVLLHWVLVLVLFIIMKVLGASLRTGWTVLVGIFFAFSFLIYLRYNSGHWREIKVVEKRGAVIQDDFHEPSDL